MGAFLRFSRQLLCALALASATARADEPTLPDAFRQRIEEGVESGAWQSVAVGLVRDGATTSAFFGHLDGHDGAAMDAHSRVELGALSEAFTGLLLADLVLAGKVRLGDTLADALPSDSTFADAALGKLTLEQLATFRGGLPVLPPNLFPRSERDPFADYDSAALRALLAHAHARAGAGGGALDAAALALALEQRTGGDVAALLRSRVIAELGLEHTGFGDGELVVGHDLGETATPWHYAALAPARGLRSDLDDQLKFAQALLRPGDGTLHAALLLARQARGDAALGWHTLTLHSDDENAGDPGWPLLWNGGSSGGHASFVGVRVDRQQAVVLLGNASSDLSALGIALLGDAAPPALPQRLRRLGGTGTGDYGGLYRFDAKDEVIVRADGDGLALQRRGQFPLPLVAFDDDAFLVPGANAQITFQRNGARRVESLLLHQGGLNLAAARLSQRAPQLTRTASTPDAAQLAACAGDYALGDFLQLRLAPQGDSLGWQLSGSAPRALVAFAPQRFASSDGAFELRCVADDKGMVNALELNLAGAEIEVPRVRWSASATTSAAAKSSEAPAAAAGKTPTKK